MVLSSEGFSTKNDVPEEYLSHKERYENAIRKACILFEVFREYAKTHNTLDAFE